MELSNNSISLAGEFAVLSELFIRGFDATVTFGHSKAVDILVSDPHTKRQFQAEVKTRYRTPPLRHNPFGKTIEWMMYKKHEDITDPKLFYVFVAITPETGAFRFFIVPSRIVARYVKAQYRYWLKSQPQPVSRDHETRRFRIGLAATGYPIPTPKADDYENKWEFR